MARRGSVLLSKNSSSWCPFCFSRQKESVSCTQHLSSRGPCAPRAAADGGAARARSPCPGRAKLSLPGPRGSSARPRRAAAGWAPRPSVSELSQTASFWAVVAHLGTGWWR